MEILKGVLMLLGGGVVVSISVLAIVIAGIKREETDGTEDEQW